ncbi:pirin family protein [Aeromicrobium fastidiosum]|uniref:pirin family protein n=1 Tax=Aeromicrobium fastidiosum TaxID=52699 RepID=UPI0020236204|nr:pirin family protein [Aeromicrobium fastidiosum]MCL8252519.1 pirin family protein [Aeromicrobium fastidiosum]
MPELRRAERRFHTAGDGVETWHSFSYGVHYDPEQIGFGPIMAINTEHVAPGRGYDVHEHADVEIVTWVLEGVLRHEDSTGQSGDVRPGTAQRLSAGTGVRHSERNGSDTEPLVFVQTMLRSSRDDAPEYAQVEVPGDTGVLVPTVDVHAPAEVFALRLAPGGRAVVPAAARVLVVVTSGTVVCGDLLAGEGDELRSADGLGLELASPRGAAALVWLLHA